MLGCPLLKGLCPELASSPAPWSSILPGDSAHQQKPAALWVSVTSNSIRSLLAGQEINILVFLYPGLLRHRYSSPAGLQAPICIYPCWQTQARPTNTCRLLQLLGDLSFTRYDYCRCSGAILKSARSRSWKAVFGPRGSIYTPCLDSIYMLTNCHIGLRHPPWNMQA